MRYALPFQPNISSPDYELHQIVRTVQKTRYGRKINLKQHTDFVFQTESVFFLVVIFHCRINRCAYFT